MYKRPFFELIAGTYGNVAKLLSGLTGIKFGTANELYQDSNGHVVLINKTTSKNIYIEATDGNIDIKRSTLDMLRIGIDFVGSFRNLRLYNGKYAAFYNNDSTKYGFIKSSGGNGVEGPIDFYNSNTTQLLVQRLLSDGIGLALQNGGQRNLKFVQELVNIPIGQGSLGVNSTAFIPAGAIIHSILWYVTQAPGGGATTWEACRIGSANQEIADAGTLVAAGTAGNSILNADGNMPKDTVQVAAVGITVTTDLDVTVAPMLIRFVVCYESITNLTS